MSVYVCLCSPQELEKTREALVAKKAALDKSWGETKDLKRTLAELTAAKDVSTACSNTRDNHDKKK